MGTTYICFNLQSFSSSVENNSILEKDYNLVYKPLIQFLYSHKEFPFSFSLTGNQLCYFKKKKTEIFSILKDLLDRKQIEILGGGYYDPILPLIYPVDRNGQIDLLSTEIRHSLGKRPRGMTLHSDIWDSSLVNNIHTCGIEYVLLDSSLIPENKQTFLPLIMTDLGKSVDIFPYYKDLNPTCHMTPEEFVNKILERVEYVEKKYPLFQMAPERTVNLNLNHDEMYKLVNEKWFAKLFDYLQTIDNVKLSTPYYFKKDFKLKIPAYITSGMNDNISKLVGTPFKENNQKNKINNTIFDYLETYKLSHSLYCRMMYVSMLVNQYKNDKQRKKSARDELWKAQNGNYIVWSGHELKSNFTLRQKAYKKLMEVEKIIREDVGKFKETVTSFDYNNDGLNEYVCRMQSFFAYISLISGSVQELELLKNTGNYADNMSRLASFDGCNDDYKRGLFVDHIFSDKHFSQYINNESAGDGIFSKVQYNEIKYSQGKREIQLEARALLKNNYKIYLRKKYIINSNGMYVQYIIRNDGEKKLKTKFAVECNFACLNYNSEDVNYYNLDVVANNEKYLINDERKILSGSVENLKENSHFTEDNIIENVSFVRITDIDNGIAFDFEPNEKCGFCYNNIEFKRPDYTGKVINVEKTLVSTLFWDMEIEPGRETEKNINFTINNVKKIKRN